MLAPLAGLNQFLWVGSADRQIVATAHRFRLFRIWWNFIRYSAVQGFVRLQRNFAGCLRCHLLPRPGG